MTRSAEHAAPVELAPGILIGPGQPLVFIAGPCVIESREQALRIAAFLRELADRHNLRMVFKASFDKANRSSLDSFRGPGIERGLETLAAVRAATGLPLLTDVHEAGQAAVAAEVVDVLQVPAFLCRQTDLIAACGATGKAVNVKKGQFMAPHDMRNAVDKVHATGNRRVTLTERGSSFGYNNLVVDLRSLAIMRRFAPVVVRRHPFAPASRGSWPRHRRRQGVLPRARARRRGGRGGRGLRRGARGPGERPLGRDNAALSG